ncbi:MAG: hypothetical protein LBG24_10365, partial [Treponema sp.]|nr:hypothetical protein [Treponema sp.]
MYKVYTIPMFYGSLRSFACGETPMQFRFAELHKDRIRPPAPGSRLPAPGSRLPAPGSRLPAPGSRLPAPGSRLPAPG